jgi:alkanesulfonate monooxygenase SsuD/methylene tetrahydromethanopterin reductase-like flavin-dependent oxidoreductase (luciferase family)
VGVCDRDGAADAARKDLFSYGVVGAYAQAFRRAGFDDEIDALEAAHAKGDRDGAVAAISDRMVDAIDICGDATSVAAAVDAYRAAGVDHPVVMPLPWGPDRRQTVLDTLAAVAGH